jgi:hypothetical protein
MSLHNVVLDGTVLAGQDAGEVKLALGRLLKQPIQVVDGLLAGKPKVIKSNVDKLTGERYINALQGIGVACRLETVTIEIDPLILVDLDGANAQSAKMASSIASQENSNLETSLVQAEPAKSELSQKWKRVFSLIDKAGGVSLPKLRELSIKERMSISFNGWAMIFGPLYYFQKKMWLRGFVLLFFAGAVITLLDVIRWNLLFDEKWLGATVGYGSNAVFASFANVDYYKKIKGIDSSRYKTLLMAFFTFAVAALLSFKFGEASEGESVAISNEIESTVGNISVSENGPLSVQYSALKSKLLSDGMPVVSWATQGYGIDTNTRLFCWVDQFNDPKSCQLDIKGRQSTNGAEAIPKWALSQTWVCASRNAKVVFVNFFGPNKPIRLYFDGDSKFTEIDGYRGSSVGVDFSGQIRDSLLKAKSVKALHGISGSEISFVYDMAGYRTGVSLADAFCKNQIAQAPLPSVQPESNQVHPQSSSEAMPSSDTVIARNISVLEGTVAPPDESGDLYLLKLNSPQEFSSDADCGVQQKADIELWAESGAIKPFIGQSVSVRGELDCPRGGYVLRLITISRR